MELRTLFVLKAWARLILANILKNLSRKESRCPDQQKVKALLLKNNPNLLDSIYIGIEILAAFSSFAKLYM